MQETNLPVEKLIELGDGKLIRDDYINAIRFYRNALKSDPGNKDILLKLAQTYSLKAQLGSKTRSADYQFAMDYYRNIIRLEPSNDDAHHKLIFLAMKNHQLGDLAAEYNEKIQKNPENMSYKNYQQQLSVLALFDKEINKFDIKTVKYKPNLFFTIFFDFIYLPLCLALAILSVFNSKFNGLFLDSIALILFYIAYRAVIRFAQKH